MLLRDAKATDMPVSPGEALQVWIDTEEEAGSVWAAATVESIDESNGDFMVLVTEWDALDPDDDEYAEAYEEGPFTAEEEGDEWRRAVQKPVAAAAPVPVGEPLQVWIDTEEAAGSVWAAASVQSVDAASGDFMVLVTEWDALDPDDDEYAEAYEEGPFTAEEEGDEWRRLPVAATAALSASDAEVAAVAAVASAVGRLKRAGLDDGDRREWPQLSSAVEALYGALAGAPPIATDPRLVGDWRLVGCTSAELSRRKGLTGLGAAPFTKLGALHFSFAPDGRVSARETLEFFGKPVIMNMLRGSVGFSPDGGAMQERYTEADLGGQPNSPAFSGAEATLTASAISTDGTLRVGRSDDGVLVFRKLPPGGLASYLDETMLPTEGGTYLGNPTWAGPVERAP